MRIALVAQDPGPRGQPAPPAARADAARVSALADALAQLGHRVAIYRRPGAAPPGTRRAPGAPATVEQVAVGPPDPVPGDALAPHWELGGRLAGCWRRDAPDVVHAHFWTSGLAALAGARGLGVPVLQTFESLGAAEQRHGLPRQGPAARIPVEACIARHAAAVLASSSEERSELARLGVRRTLVAMVPCGVDTTRFSPDGPVAPRGGRPRLLAAASLAEPRDVSQVVRALAEVPGAELVVTGGPPRGHLRGAGAYRDLAGLAARLGVQDRVIFTGQVSAACLPALLRSADLLVSVTPYAPTGMAAIQAMACGTPVVAAAVGSHQDTVVDGTTGVLLPPARPGLLAVTLRHLLATPLRMAAYGIAAADRASARYSWDRIAQETVAAYEHARAF